MRVEAHLDLEVSFAAVFAGPGPALREAYSRPGGLLCGASSDAAIARRLVSGDLQGSEVGDLQRSALACALTFGHGFDQVREGHCCFAGEGLGDRERPRESHRMVPAPR